MLSPPMTPLMVSLLVQGSAWGPYPPVAPYSTAMPPRMAVVVRMVFPVIANCRWKNDYGAPRAGFRHTGIDIRAPKMSPIVAPFGGTLGLKRESFWIYADDGWAMLGTHLNDDLPGRRDHRASKDFMFAPDLVPGGRVRAGQLIGYVGESGMATGPHLHFEIYAPGDGPTTKRIRNPFLSLKASRRLSAPVPMLLSGKPPTGTMRLDGCLREVNAKRGTVTLILVRKHLPNGRTVCVSHPRYVRLKMRKAELESGELDAIPGTTPIGVLVPAGGKVDGASVSRMILPSP